VVFFIQKIRAAPRAARALFT
jgi:hypothetical protein